MMCLGGALLTAAEPRNGDRRVGERQTRIHRCRSELLCGGNVAPLKRSADDDFRIADHPLRMVSGTIHDATTGSAADRIKRGIGMESGRTFCQFTLANRGAGVEPRRFLAPWRSRDCGGLLRCRFLLRARPVQMGTVLARCAEHLLMTIALSIRVALPSIQTKTFYF